MEVEKTFLEKSFYLIKTFSNLLFPAPSKCVAFSNEQKPWEVSVLDQGLYSVATVVITMVITTIRLCEESLDPFAVERKKLANNWNIILLIRNSGCFFYFKRVMCT